MLLRFFEDLTVLIRQAISLSLMLSAGKLCRLSLRLLHRTLASGNSLLVRATLVLVFIRLKRYVLLGTNIILLGDAICART